jgi:hypothetical protein
VPHLRLPAPPPLTLARRRTAASRPTGPLRGGGSRSAR